VKWALGVLHFSDMPTEAEIVTRRRELARLFHSDIGGNDQMMANINEAVTILKKSQSEFRGANFLGNE